MCTYGTETDDRYTGNRHYKKVPGVRDASPIWYRDFLLTVIKAIEYNAQEFEKKYAGRERDKFGVGTFRGP
jgi:hypothetical protein